MRPDVYTNTARPAPEPIHTQQECGSNFLYPIQVMARHSVRRRTPTFYLCMACSYSTVINRDSNRESASSIEKIGRCLHNVQFVPEDTSEWVLCFTGYTAPYLRIPVNGYCASQGTRRRTLSLSPTGIHRPRLFIPRYPRLGAKTEINICTVTNLCVLH